MVGRLPGTDISTWKIDRIKYYQSDKNRLLSDDKVISNTIMFGAGNACLINSAFEIVQNMHIENVLFWPYQDIWGELAVLRVPYSKESTLWLNRCYGISDWTYNNVGFYNAGLSLESGRQEGHGVYLNLYNGVSFNNCEFVRNKGQAIQTVVRLREGNVPSNEGAGGKIEIKNSLFRENGNPLTDRAGYCISIFGTGTNQDVLIENIVLETLRYPTFIRDGFEYNSMAGILLASVGESFGWSADGPIPFTQGHVILRNCKIHMSRPYGELLKSKACKSLTVENCEFIADGQTRGILIDALNGFGPNSGTIHFHNNSGNASLKIRGKSYHITDNIDL